MENGTESKNDKKRKIRGPDSPGFCRPGPCQILLAADYGQEQPLHPTEGVRERGRQRERERGRQREREREEDRERGTKRNRDESIERVRRTLGENIMEEEERESGSDRQTDIVVVMNGHSKRP